MSADRLLVRGGRVVDGAGAEPHRADVMIVDGVIAEIGDTLDSGAGDRVLDADDRLVVPGFIDAHAHADGAVFRPDAQRALLRQGVTTVIGGQDGVSYAPGDGAWASRYFAAINGPHPTFTGGSVADLLATYDGTTPLGVGYLVPAGTVRHAVMGMDASPPTVCQLADMTRLVETGLADGALGLSTGLDYVPGIFAEARELAALCTPVTAAGGLYVTHMRGGYETAAAAGLAEVAKIVRMSGVRAHISHYHVDAADGIRLIDDLAARGVDVSFDMYPYTRGCTLVAMALLPPEYSAGSVAEAVALLGDPDERARLRADWFPLITDKPSLGPAWPDMVVIAHAPRAPRAAGLSLRAEAARRGVDVVDATLDLLIENALEVSAVMAVRDERPTSNLARLFSHPAYTGGSDGIYIGDAPHPRGWGTFARLLGTYTREVGAFGWTQAVRRLAGLPAERYGLHDRGVLTPGRRGDVALVDPDTVADRATYAQRTALAIGIDDVVVAGVPVLAGGELTGATPGAAARRTGPARS